MFSQITLWEVTCDKCNKAFATGDNESDCFLSKGEAIEVIHREGWRSEGGKIYCENCFVNNDS